MSHIVQTYEGKVAHATVPMSKEPLTEEAATSLCESMNDKARELGIKTRYEVKPS